MVMPKLDEEAIFNVARQIEAAEARRLYLQQSCGDDAELQARVEALLRVHEEERSFLQPPVEELRATVDEQPISERPGTVIGSYKLLEQIGEGGFGVVFMAEQQEPIRRKVALKVLKPGMDTRQVVARFEAERQALALMDHLNIAKILDAGETASGRPYFVMDLVRGVPITDYCDQAQFTPRERLELFVYVCQAVQHAHQKGIIHRDLKPSNVLVTLQDGTAVVKVIDFGIAKALGQQLTDKTLFTGFAQMLGTPLYMSPEQAALSNVDVDTRSDIYSLGVLLYELLTGTTPFDKERLQQAGYDEMRRIIREEEPPRPSTRMSTLGQAATTVSAQRKSDPKRLSQLFRGELDWIVMKALEKDRNRRYETASAFAADVQRYLHDEPVLACPPSALYRFRKFARRHKAALAVAGLILFFVLILGGGAGWVMRDRAARQATLEQEVVRALADVENASKSERLPEALAAVKRAEGLLTSGGVNDELQDCVRQWRVDLGLVARLQEARMLGLQVNVAENHFSPELAVPAYAAAFRDYGLEPTTVTAEDAAQRIRSRPPEIQLAVVAALDAWIDLTRGQASKDQHQQAWLRDIVREVDTDSWRLDMRAAFEGKNLQKLIDLAASPDLVKQPPYTQLRHGVLLYANGKIEEGLRVLRRAQQMHPGDFWINHGLYMQMSQAIPTQREERVRFASICVALQPDNAGAHLNLGNAFKHQGKLEEAMTAYRQAIALKPKYFAAYYGLAFVFYYQGKLEEAIAELRRVIDLKPDFVDAHRNLGMALSEQGNLDEAIAEYRKAIDLEPNNASAHHSIGIVFEKQGKGDQAIAAYRKAIRLKAAYPEAHYDLGHTLQEQGKLDEAIVEYRKAIQLKPDYSQAHNNLGSALYRQGKLGEALTAYREAIKHKPDNVKAHNNLANALADQGKLDEAIAEYRQAIKLKRDYADAHNSLGVALMRQDKLDDAIASYREAIKHEPDHADAHNNLGNALSRQRRWDEAIRTYRQAIKLKPDYPEPHRNLGDALYAQGNLAEAIAEHRQAIKLKADYVEAHNSLGMALTRQGKVDEAIAAFRGALQVKPDHGAPLWNLSSLLANGPDPMLRDPRQAIELAKKGMALGGGAGWWQTLGWAYYRAGAWKESIAALEKSIELDPVGADPAQWLFLAMAHWQLGHKDKARQWYDRSVAWIDKNKEVVEKQKAMRFVTAACTLRAEAAKLLGVPEKK
ncbi:MAG: tetratricopeptide repeat protein [Planctomycetes bacterium]|nr:tetratricopeptide repeat protein [Planctomycetota bacterium]